MDAQDFKILKTIDSIQENTNMKNLHTIMDFSRGNFNYHIEHVNKVLLKLGYTDINMSKTILDWKNKNKNFKLSYVIDKTNNYIFSHECRQSIVILMIFMTKNITLEGVSIFLGVSVNTIFNDIQEINSKFNFGWLNTKIRLVNHGKGYSFAGTDIDVRKLFINTLLFIKNQIDFDIIKDQLIKLITFDFKNIKKDLKITNQEIHIKITKIILKHIHKLDFVNLEFETLVFYLMIIYLSKIINVDLSVIKKLDKSDRQIQQFSFNISSIIIDEINDEFKLEHKNQHFEKFILACLLSSPNQKIVCKNQVKELTSFRKYLENLFNNLTSHGYNLDYEYIDSLINYLNYLKHSFLVQLIEEHSKSFKDNFFTLNDRYINLYKIAMPLLSNLDEIVDKQTFMHQKREFIMTIIPCIIDWPIIHDTTNKIETVVVTDLKGGLINWMIINLNETQPQLKVVKIINWYHYQTQRRKFTSMHKVSDSNKILYEPNSTFFNIEREFIEYKTGISQNEQELRSEFKNIITSNKTITEMVEDLLKIFNKK